MNVCRTLRLIFVLCLAADVACGATGGSQANASTKKSEVQAAPDKPSRKHTGVLSVEVKEASAKPVASAKVTLTDSVTGEKTYGDTDDKGQCKLSGLFPGTYEVQAEKGDSKSDSQGIKISNDATTTVKLVFGKKS